MLRVVRSSLKYLVFGILIGLFFAPRRGDETRQIVLNWIGNAVGGLLGVEDEAQAQA